MAEKHDIEIVITPEGDVRVQVRGVRGPACEQMVRKIAADLGRMKEFVRSSEYYETGKAKTDITRKLSR